MTQRIVHRIPRSRALLRSRYADFFGRLETYLESYKSRLCRDEASNEAEIKIKAKILQEIKN